MKKVLILVGTRPEVVKMAPVFQELRRVGDVEPIFCVTGQHDEMLHQALSAFEIVPEVNLGVMKAGQSLADLTSSILRGTTSLIEDMKPDTILVHGDTTTGFAGALAGFYQQVKIGHVEAGLRTFDLAAPFPEEANRQLISRIADWNFSPTTESAANLAREGISSSAIFVTGNTVVDSLRLITSRFESDSEFKKKTLDSLAKITGLSPLSQKMVLVTAHRRENLEYGLAEICRALVLLSRGNTDMSFVFPLHPNPRVRETVEKELRGHSGIVLTEPLPYPELVLSLMISDAVLTDSGGIQEESVTLGKRVLVLRDKTERAEGMTSGLLSLVGANAEKIVEEFNRVDSFVPGKDSSTQLNFIYGDGEAAKRISEVIRTGETVEWSPKAQ